MGYNIGAFIVGAGDESDEADLLARIRPGHYVAAGTVSIAEATLREFRGTAAGQVGDKTLVLNQRWIFACSFEESDLSEMEQALAALSEQAPVFALLIDETSMLFGFSYFEHGRRTRVRQVDPGGVRADDGTPLPAEAGFPDEERDDSTRLMAITESMLGTRLSRLIFDDEVTLMRYVEKTAD